MKQNLKKMISYYKPYLGVFFIDMFFAPFARASAKSFLLYLDAA